MLLSVFVSIFSATMALRSAQIAQRTQTALYREIAIFTGALALGGGIWTMHFIGMLAFELPAHVAYDLGLTLLSLVPACIASWVALRMLSLPTVTGRRLITGGLLVGLGIGAMHYSGMAAMRTSLEMRYEPFTFVLSLFVAIALAILALWVRYGMQRTPLHRYTRLLVSGVVMGLAIAGMHYTGMAAVRFIGVPGAVSNGVFLNATYASIILSSFTMTVTVMVLALNGLIRIHDLYLQLEEGTSRLRATLDTAVDGIITIDTRGLIQDYNQSAERLFGWTADEVRGRNIKMLMPEPYQSAHDGYLRNYLTSGHARIIGTGREVVGLRKDGSHMPMRLAVGRVELPGELLFVGFVSDISDRHALENSLRETAERAEQAAAAKSTFLANMSHEIRTPMNSIIGFTELLLQTDLTPEQRGHMNTVRQSSRSLLRLLNDILDTTKMEKGRLELENTDFSMKGLAMQIESSLRLSAQARRLVLLTRYPPDMPVHFRGDPLRVLQILFNLVGNAIKFTEAGSVEVGFAYESGVVHVQIRDTGIGMTPQQIESIFAPFTQADASISRRFGGSGLGTTIARQLVELMGGSIDVDSTHGEGSTFHVRLPLPLGQAPDHASTPVEMPSLPTLSILIADDVPQNLELLALTLEGAGHDVTMARDGNEAVSRYMAAAFDVVLMDVHMPGIDGLQATRLIRQHERTHGLRTVPIIALTASVMAEDRRVARQAGMDGFAAKPIEPADLFGEIARLVDIDTPMETPVRVAEPSLPPVIDWENGLALWGSRARLTSALTKFLDGVDQRYPLPDRLTAPVDWEKLQFSVHGLRGAAGNLGLAGIAAVAGTMEELLRAGRGGEALPRLPVLRELLEQVRAAVAEESAATSQPDPSAPSTGVGATDVGHAGQEAAAAPTCAESVAMVLRLLELLRHSELDDALTEAVCSALESEGERPRAQALRDALDSFEFGEARRLLEQFVAQRDCGIPS